MNYRRLREPRTFPRAGALFALSTFLFAVFAFFSPNILSPFMLKIAEPPWRFHAGKVLEHIETPEKMRRVSVLARPRWSAYDTLIVGAGTHEGVTSGARVFAGEFFIGEVTEVYAHTALISLHSTPGRETVVLLRGQFPVEMVGVGGGSFEASLARNTPVSEGDALFISEELSPVAVIGSVRTEGEGVVRLFARLPLNLFELREVFVRLSP